MRVGRGWERGRRDSGYDKLLLVEGRRFDVYLLHFPTGSFVPLHRDPTRVMDQMTRARSRVTR